MASPSSSSGFDYIITTTSFTVTPPPNSRSSTSFVYAEYDDYDEYSSYYISIPSDPPNIISTTTNNPTTTTTSITTGQPRETAPTHLFEKKTSPPIPIMPSATVPIIPTQGQTAEPVWMSSLSVDRDDIITATSSPEKTSGGTSLQTKSEPTATSSPPPSFFPFSKRDNNSVDEVSYRIVGVDGDMSRGQQNYFVPRMPPFRERTQNKRIQQLLNEKRRQGLPKRSSRSRKSRRDTKYDGL